MDEPKVIPMIRGKAFEFVILEKLKEILDEDIWEVSKPTINAQLAVHDIDVLVLHKETQEKIVIECKLAKKGSCRVDRERTTIKVKCMRSRTLGAEMVRQLSPQLGIPEDVLSVHNDQYLEKDFDFVITSIGNAFYDTSDNSTFFFSPTESQKIFLGNLPGENLKDEAFYSLYLGSAKEISVKSANGVECTRRRCTNKIACGFIPNYPDINFNTSSLEPINNWSSLDNANEIFLEHINSS